MVRLVGVAVVVVELHEARANSKSDQAEQADEGEEKRVRHAHSSLGYLSWGQLWLASRRAPRALLYSDERIIGSRRGAHGRAKAFRPPQRLWTRPRGRAATPGRGSRATARHFAPT